VPAVGGLGATAQRHEQEHLRHSVGDRVRRLGKHCGRTAQECADGLGHRDREVGDHGDEDGDGALSGVVGAALPDAVRHLGDLRDLCVRWLSRLNPRTGGRAGNPGRTKR